MSKKSLVSMWNCHETMWSDLNRSDYATQTNYNYRLFQWVQLNWQCNEKWRMWTLFRFERFPRLSHLWPKRSGETKVTPFNGHSIPKKQPIISWLVIFLVFVKIGQIASNLTFINILLVILCSELEFKHETERERNAVAIKIFKVV